MRLPNYFEPNPALSPEVNDEMKKVAMKSFPGGQKQYEEETGQLHALLRGKLTMDESGFLLRRTKALLIFSEDKSETRIAPSIRVSMKGKLTEHEARLVYVFLTGVFGPVTAGGDGSSKEQAVIINATSTNVGVTAEYDYIKKKYGQENVDWERESQMLTRKQLDGKIFDIVTVKLKDGSSRTFWFDITAFYGKF